MQSEQKEKEATQSLISEQSSFKDRFEELKFDAVRILQALPPAFNEGDFMVALASLSSQSGVILKTIDIGNPSEEGVVVIKAQIVGTITSLERFLQSLETSLPLFDFMSTSFEGGEGIESFALDIVTHVAPKGPEQMVAASQLKEKIEASLAAKLDILKDPQFQVLSPIKELPVSEPGRESVGRENPFAPL